MNSQPPHLLHQKLLISTARWPIAPLEQPHKWQIVIGKFLLPINLIEKDIGLDFLAGLHHQSHSRTQSHYYSEWRLWAAVFRPWPGSPFLRQPGDIRLPHCHHIDTELSADILSTWRSMMKNPQPQAIHHIQFSSSWVTGESHHPQLEGPLLKHSLILLHPETRLSWRTKN